MKKHYKNYKILKILKMKKIYKFYMTKLEKIFKVLSKKQSKYLVNSKLIINWKLFYVKNNKI